MSAAQSEMATCIGSGISLGSSVGTGSPMPQAMAASSSRKVAARILIIHHLNPSHGPPFITTKPVDHGDPERQVQRPWLLLAPGLTLFLSTSKWRLWLKNQKSSPKIEIMIQRRTFTPSTVSRPPSISYSISRQNSV